MPRILALLVFLICFGSHTLLAQNAAPPSFEVATIKLNHSESPLEDVRILPGRLIATNASLRALIAEAFRLPANRIGAIPEAFEKLRFDIQAKMSEEQFAQIEHMGKHSQDRKVDLMLQSLLADRFKLVVSHHSREGKVLALVVAKGGARLISAGSHDVPRLRPDKGRRSFSGAILVDHDITLHDFSNRLSDMFDRPVQDQTGLNGSYDILFEVPISDDEDHEAAIVTALEDQLGLSLKRQTATVDTIAIDHIEAPSEN